jgi:hypothetical protein
MISYELKNSPFILRIPRLIPQKSPLPLFSKEGLKFYGKSSPFEKGGQRGI